MAWVTSERPSNTRWLRWCACTILLKWCRRRWCRYWRMCENILSKLTEIRQNQINVSNVYCICTGNRTQNAKQIKWKYSETRDRRERILISSLCKYFIQQIASRACSNDERSTNSFSAYAGNSYSLLSAGKMFQNASFGLLPAYPTIFTDQLHSVFWWIFMNVFIHETFLRREKNTHFFVRMVCVIDEFIQMNSLWLFVFFLLEMSYIELW